MATFVLQDGDGPREQALAKDVRDERGEVFEGHGLEYGGQGALRCQDHVGEAGELALVGVDPLKLLPEPNHAGVGLQFLQQGLVGLFPQQDIDLPVGPAHAQSPRPFFLLRPSLFQLAGGHGGAAREEGTQAKALARQNELRRVHSHSVEDMEVRPSGNQDEGGRDPGGKKVRKRFQCSAGQDKIHLFVQVVHELFTSGQYDARSTLASEAVRGTPLEASACCLLPPAHFIFLINGADRDKISLVLYTFFVVKSTEQGSC